MNRYDYLAFIIINLLIFNSISGNCHNNTTSTRHELINQDTVNENQMLYNGRIWRNQYPMIKENQFLFSKEFLPGSVTMRGKTFSNLMIKYDIFADEILIPFNPAGILQLNKLMVDSFSIFFLNKKYIFLKVSDSTDNGMNGYFNELYNGKTRLIARYVKKIEKLADGGKYDKFYQINRIYLVIDGNLRIIRGKKDFFRIFSEEKKAIRNYINKNNILIRKENVESIVPILRFIDSLPK